MKHIFIFLGLLTAVFWNLAPSFAESERSSPSRPHFDSVEAEIDSLLSLSFVSNMFLDNSQGDYFGPEDEPFFTPEDMKTIRYEWQSYIRSIVQKIFETLRTRGIDPDNFTSVYDLLAAFITGSDLNTDGILTKDEMRGMIINALPWGITRALVFDRISRRPKDEMIPAILKDLKEGLAPDGDLKKIIRELCEAEVLTGPLCELPLLPECPTDQRKNGGTTQLGIGRDNEVAQGCGIPM